MVEEKQEAVQGRERKISKEGKFIDYLKRGNKQIRDDRAEAIGEDARMMYKRAIEDLEVKIKRMERERENMLDQSPENALSLKLATDFDAVEYVKTDMELGWKIRNEQIKLDLAKKQFAVLFGGAE